MNKLATFLRESATARFFIPLGILLLVFGVIMFVINKGNKDYIKTDAIVSKVELVEESFLDENGNTIEAVYKVFVKYTVDDRVYEEELGELSGYEENEKVTIYYNPQDPSKIVQTKSIILPIGLMVVGISSLVGGIISGMNAFKRQKKMHEQERNWSNEWIFIKT